MGTSGSVNFTVNRNELIKDALIDIGRASAEDSVPPAVNEHANRSLNMLLKAYQSKGMQLWKLKRLTLFLEKDKYEYSLGPTGDNITQEWDHTTNKTEIRTAAVATDTVIDIDSNSNMIDGDYIGIELDDGSMYWTTIVSSTSTTVTITDAIETGDTVAIDRDVYFYTTKAERPLMIVPDQIWIKLVSDGSTRPITLISREEFWRLSNKDSDGSISQAYFDPALTNAVLRTFTQPSSVVEVLEFIAQMPIEDMDDAANDFDVPQEWYLAIKFNLALILAPSHGVRREQYNNIKELAINYLAEAESFDTEKTSVFIRPEIRRYT